MCYVCTHHSHGVYDTNQPMTILCSLHLYLEMLQGNLNLIFFVFLKAAKAIEHNYAQEVIEHFL